MGGTQSRSWSIGNMPFTTSSAVVEINEGNTRPGQSQSIRSWSTNSVCQGGEKILQLPFISMTTM